MTVENFAILATIGIIIATMVYFIPTFVACGKKRTNKTSIFVLNLFLGWTLIGWVVALVWAFKEQ